MEAGVEDEDDVIERRAGSMADMVVDRTVNGSFDIFWFCPLDTGLTVQICKGHVSSTTRNRKKASHFKVVRSLCH